MFTVNLPCGLEEYAAVIELPMTISEYDTILRSIDGDYGGLTAMVLADRFEDCGMLRHAELCRDKANRSIWHPWIQMSDYPQEDIISSIHYALTKARDVYGICSLLHMKYGVILHPGSTVENPILESAKW